jgi:hypothetical protein
MAGKHKRQRGVDFSGGPKDGGAPYRGSMSPAQSKAHFTKHAKTTHELNLPDRLPMRGGIRM